MQTVLQILSDPLFILQKAPCRLYYGFQHLQLSPPKRNFAGPTAEHIMSFSSCYRIHRSYTSFTKTPHLYLLGAPKLYTPLQPAKVSEWRRNTNQITKITCNKTKHRIVYSTYLMESRVALKRHTLLSRNS